MTPCPHCQTPLDNILGQLEDDNRLHSDARCRDVLHAKLVIVTRAVEYMLTWSTDEQMTRVARAALEKLRGE